MCILGVWQTCWILCDSFIYIILKHNFISKFASWQPSGVNPWMPSRRNCKSLKMCTVTHIFNDYRVSSLKQFSNNVSYKLIILEYTNHFSSIPFLAHFCFFHQLCFSGIAWNWQQECVASKSTRYTHQNFAMCLYKWSHHSEKHK